jgi:hypothetical protein
MDNNNNPSQNNFNNNVYESIHNEINNNAIYQNINPVSLHNSSYSAGTEVQNNNDDPNKFTESLNRLNSHSNHLQQATDIQDGNITPNDTFYNGSSENDNISPVHTSISDPNYQQQYDALNNTIHHNYKQYIQQPGISNNTAPDHTYHHNYQQPMSNVASDNNDTTSSDNNHYINIPHHNNQQSTSINNAFPPQVYHDQNQPSTLYSNILSPLNSFGINISSQATIIILPTTNSDTQSQLQQILTHLNNK